MIIGQGCFFTCYRDLSRQDCVLLREGLRTRPTETRHIHRVVEYLQSVKELQDVIPKYYDFNLKRGWISMEEFIPMNLNPSQKLTEEQWLSIMFQSLSIAQLLTKHKINHNDLKLDNFVYQPVDSDLKLTYQVNGIKYEVPTLGMKLYVTDFNFTEVYAHNKTIKRVFDPKIYERKVQVKDFRGRVGMSNGFNTGFNTYQVIGSLYDYLDDHKENSILKQFSAQSGVSFNYVMNQKIYHRDSERKYTDHDFSHILEIEIFKRFRTCT